MRVEIAVSSKICFIMESKFGRLGENSCFSICCPHCKIKSLSIALRLKLKLPAHLEDISI